MGCSGTRHPDPWTNRGRSLVLYRFTSTMNEEVLKFIVSGFPAVEFAFAYGSGAMPQEGYDLATAGTGGSVTADAPQVDVIFVVQNPLKWHEANLSMNASHYSALQYMGAAHIAQVQDDGPGVPLPTKPI